MDTIDTDLSGRPAGNYEKAFRDMLAFREEFLKLSKSEQERLIRASVPVWSPKADPIKTRFIVSTVMKLLG